MPRGLAPTALKRTGPPGVAVWHRAADHVGEGHEYAAMDAAVEVDVFPVDAEGADEAVGVVALLADIPK